MGVPKTMNRSTTILTPPTPFEKRMEQLSSLFPPPPSHPLHDTLGCRAEISAEGDIAFRLWLKALNEKLPSFIFSRLKGGTEFPIANILRVFFLEYASRIIKHGPHSFPSSFNVVESFLTFSYDFFMFDLREERDHLLRLYDYIDWYTSGGIAEDPMILTDTVTEGVIYSYNMVAPAEDFKLNTQDSELVITGVSIVRHSTEVSMIALCGETPPTPSDAKISDYFSNPLSARKEDFKSDTTFSISDRYLKELPGFSRVIGLVRFDLKSRRYFVRYLHQDIGPDYIVASDDPTIFQENLTQSGRKQSLQFSSETLKRYDPLFGSLVTLMFLPVFFIAEQDRVNHTTFSTELHTRRPSTKVKKVIRDLGPKSVWFSRKVFCLESISDVSLSEKRTIVPPDLKFATNGFWKSLAPGQIGEDKEGNAIVGKTWVERTDTWSSHGFEQFVMKKRENRA
ncbi:MAG: hypothetical protein OXG96_01805, partial [Acidobacteria bacterium]|nr:hypothetical protein [Acidobacteriota bacterium]